MLAFDKGLASVSLCWPSAGALP